MCGIFGICGINDVNGDLIKKMREKLFHRGPDDVGYFHDKGGNIAFGLRRLSIIDILGGHQPMSNHDKSIWVAYNGEIYNYIELRDDLENKGYSFKTKSDVEVLLYLY